MINNSGTDIAQNVIVVKIAQTLEQFEQIRLTKKRKSIKVTDTDKKKAVEICIDIDYNIVIPELAADIQQAVSDMLYKDLDLVLDSIDVSVEGVNIDRLVSR